MKKTFFSVILLSCLMGCVSLSSSDKTQPQLYTLNAPKSSELRSLRMESITIAKPTINTGLDTTHILLRTSPQAVSYFSEGQWTEEPSQLIPRLLAETFERTKKIKAFTAGSLPTYTNYILTTELWDFQAEYPGSTQEAPQVHVTLRAALLTTARHEILKSRTFEVLLPVEENDLPTIVRAFDKALGSVLKQTVDWAAKS